MQGHVRESNNRQAGQLIEADVFCHKSLEERAAEYDGKLLLDGEYDWGVPVGREAE